MSCRSDRDHLLSTQSKYNTVFMKDTTKPGKRSDGTHDEQITTIKRRRTVSSLSTDQASSRYKQKPKILCAQRVTASKEVASLTSQKRVLLLWMFCQYCGINLLPCHSSSEYSEYQRGPCLASPVAAHVDISTRHRGSRFPVYLATSSA